MLMLLFLLSFLLLLFFVVVEYDTALNASSFPKSQQKDDVRLQKFD